MLVNLSEASRKILVCSILAIMTIAVFWQVKGHDFINMDDVTYVLKNSHVLSGLTLDGVQWAATSVYASNWHPITWLSHMLDVNLFGVNAGRFHLVNVFFHIVSTLLLYLILNRMTRRLWRSAFVAALFALHPLHVESVAWIAERKDVLSTLFWMLTLGAYVLYVENKCLNRYLLALFFFALGLMAKPMLVTLPFALLLLDVWPLNRLSAGESIRNRSVEPLEKLTKKEKSKKKRKAQEAVVRPTPVAAQNADASMQWMRLLPLIREKIPFFVLSAATSIITVYAQQNGYGMVFMARMSLFMRLSNALMSYVLYIGKALWPQNLSVFYSYPVTWPLWQVCSAFLLLAGVTATAFYCA